MHSVSRVIRFGKRLLLAGPTMLAAAAHGSITYPAFSGCGNLTAGDFRMVPLVSKSNDPTLDQPIKMAFDMDAAGKVDIYFVQLGGAVKRFSGATGAITTLLKLDLINAGEDGLTGIALDPAFKSNHWVYLYYTHGVNGGSGANAPEYHISRFTLTGNSLGAETILIRFPGKRGTGTWHTAGAMQFDAYGDLWIGVGDNHAEQDGLPSTNDLRGCILRIHPNADGSVSIPAGNLRSVIRSFPNLAGADTAKVRPEIYVMGCRNPYTLALDPVRRWLAWGEVGPDVAQKGTGTEEDNLVKGPGFMGWPYFAGDNQPMAVGTAQNVNAANPVNAHPLNTGLKQLPPPIPPIRPYRRNAAVTGPIYRYDGASPSRIKLPPHFNRKWIVSDFNMNYFLALTLDDAGTRILSTDTVWSGGTGDLAPIRPLDIEQGPDGALYILNYAAWFGTGPNTSIRRLEYTGSCLPAEPLLEQPAPLMPQAGRKSLPGSLAGVALIGMSLEIQTAGPHRIRLSDPAGKNIFNRSGSGPQRYSLSGIGRGAYLLWVATSQGTMQRHIAMVE